MIAPRLIPPKSIAATTRRAQSSLSCSAGIGQGALSLRQCACRSVTSTVGTGRDVIVEGGGTQRGVARLGRRASRAQAREARHGALANKLARITWAIMTTGEPFRIETFAKAYSPSEPTSLRRIRRVRVWQARNRRDERRGSIPKTKDTPFYDMSVEIVPLIGTFAVGPHQGQRT